MPPTKKRATKAKPTLPKRGPGRPKKTQSTSASGKSVPSSDLAKKATPAAAVVGIFFRETLEMTTFENAEDAEAFHLKLPRSTRSKSDVVFFHSQGECDDYITNMKLDTKTSPPPVTPEKQSLPRLNVTIKQENPYKKSSAVATSSCNCRAPVEVQQVLFFKSCKVASKHMEVVSNSMCLSPLLTVHQQRSICMSFKKQRRTSTTGVISLSHGPMYLRVMRNAHPRTNNLKSGSMANRHVWSGTLVLLQRKLQNKLLKGVGKVTIP